MTEFRTSSYCNSGTCVAAAVTREGTAVRDDKNPDGPVLAFPRKSWTAFLDGIRVNRYQETP